MYSFYNILMFVQIVEYLLDMSEVVPDGQDSLTGETALSVAACNGCHTVCTTLLNRGANVSVPNQKVCAVISRTNNANS